MDAVVLSRIQFALTVGFHFLFPPLTIGLAWIIVWLMARYKRTGSDFDRDLARFWIKLFGLSFAVGVATGITMEFQFGTNWDAYSRFVGDVFGAPLAAEAIFSFFLESTFLAVLLLGWGRVSAKALWFASLMVAVGSTLSAFWILVANSWQQTPAGYHIVNGRAELTSFAQMVFNPSTLPRFLHTVDGALLTGAMFVMGISAWFLLKGRNIDFAKSSMRTALLVALVTAVIQLPIGDQHAKQVHRTQPAKFAAFEGLFETQSHAPMLFFGIPDAEKRQVRCAVGVPGMLCLLVSGKLDTVITGLNDIPRDEWPPLMMTFYPFRAMSMLGTYFIAMTALGVLLLYRKKLFENRFYLWLAVLSIPLPFLANELGWIAAEVGRQPWAVYKLLRTADAISVVVPAWQILATMIMFCAIYALLFVTWIMVLRREIRRGPGATAPASSGDGTVEL